MLQLSNTRIARAMPTPSKFEAMILSGEVIEVGAVSRPYFGAGRVVVASDVFERYVQWSSRATRECSIALSEEHRLQAMLETASEFSKHHAPPIYFVLKAVASDMGHGIEHKVGLFLRCFKDEPTPNWLITL